MMDGGGKYLMHGCGRLNWSLSSGILLLDEYNESKWWYKIQYSEQDK